MADYDLKYTGAQIDGLLDAANELKTNGFIYKGVATPSTNPGTPSERVAYLASEPGTYTNFGGIVITSGLYSLTYVSGTWTGTQMQAGSDIEVVQTTGQSASDVMSQKAVTDEITAIDTKYSPLIVVTSDNIQYPSSTIVGVTMNGGKWTSQSSRQLYIIPYTYQEGDVLHMLANAAQPSSYAFLTSDTHTAGSDVPFCDPTTQAWTYIAANTIADIPIPSNCQYIAINAYYGLTQNKTSYMPQLLQVVHNYVPAMKGILDSIDGKVDKVIIQDSYDLNNVEEKDCLPADVNWYKSGNNGKHKAISAIVGGYYRVNKPVYISWLTSAYTGTATAGTPVPYVSGTKREWTLANTIVQAPQTTAYLCITTVDGAGSVYTDLVVEKIEPQEKDILYSKDLIGEPNENNTIVDLTSYTPQVGVLLEDGSGWYKVAGYTHIAVPVVAGERYTIKAGDAGWFAYGLMKSYNGSDVTPVFCDSAKKRFNRQGVVIVDTPSDCTYIVFSATSNYVNTLPSVMCKMKILSWVLEKMANRDGGVYQQKIRYAHWNVGHFAYWGAHYTLPAYNTTITEEDSPAMQKMYRKFINEVGADIFGIAEYNPEFDLAGNLTKDVLFQNYQNQFIGQKRVYSSNSLFSNLQSISVGEVLYTHRHQDMYYKAIKVKIGDIDVMVVETHLDWHNDEPEGQPSTNTLQMQQLITAFANFDHVIISGDFNVNKIEQYQLFVDAGYTLVSGSYLDLPTYLRYLDDDQSSNDENLYLDNIIVKGFAVSNAKAWDASGWNYGTTAKYILTIKAGSRGGSISVNDINVSVTANESADSVAEKIANNVLIDGWTLTSVNNSVIVECNTVGDNTVPIRYTDGNTGIKLFSNDCPAIRGTNIGLSDHSIISCDLLIIP